MNENLKPLFSPLNMGGVVIKNRIVMPPMDTNFAGLDGSPKRNLLAYLRNRAKGGTGLIIQEAASVSYPEGKISERQICMNNRNITAELREVTDAVHAFGTKIIVQLHHGGFMANPEFCCGKENVSASAGNGAREMTNAEVKKLIQDFVDAAYNAKLSGYDGVEIHAAHMYLLNQFLNPAFNKREDEYGGSLENRFRVVKEIIEGIRKKCGRPFIVGVRLGAVDYPVGNTIDDAAEIAKMIEMSGGDMVNISIGFYTFDEAMPTQWSEEGCFVYLAEAIKKAVTIPVGIVGKLRTPSYCSDLIKDGKADFVCLGRQLICDPEWSNKALYGKEDEIRSCLNCMDGCFGSFNAHGSIRCSINPYVGYEDLYNEQNVPVAEKKEKILVVGGGIAGMQFAIISKKRGNDIILVEQSDRLGGQMQLAGMTPFKTEVLRALDWFISETNRVGIDVHLNTKVDLEYIKSVNPDKVVLAMGRVFATPPIEGIEKALCGADVISRKIPIEKDTKVIVVGGGVAGCELAHRLVLEGAKPTVMEMLPELCNGGEMIHSAKLKMYLSANAEVLTSVIVKKISEKTVTYITASGTEMTVGADAVINCAGQKKISLPLYQRLLEEGVEVYCIGDHGVSNFINSTKDAMHLAYMI